MKKTPNEKKICTLRVKKYFQRQGIGRSLIEQGFEWLDNEKPLITVHKSRRNEFKPLFDFYGFHLEEMHKNYYQLFGTELVFNGMLPENNSIICSDHICEKFYMDIFHELIFLPRQNIIMPKITLT